MGIIEIPPWEFTYSRALNLGSARARGNVLVNLSAHALPLTDEWLARLLGHFEEPQVAGVWGNQSANVDGPPSTRVYSQDLAMYLRDACRLGEEKSRAAAAALWCNRAKSGWAGPHRTPTEEGRP